MEARCLYFTLFSASNLRSVRKYKKMKVYAKVSVAGKSKCTEVDLENGTNPEWNTPFKFIIPEEKIIQAQGDKIIIEDSSSSEDQDCINKNQMAQIGTTIGTTILTAAVTVAVAVIAI
ncbi:protein SRC2 [Capsicum annuum]|uniref:protein SRC2 n=1 Tax=Capsicum annuum TaxID=4072 RepID=UPI0007BF65CD|nr:protein SRC2 [Capsicum annuum]